MYNVSDAYKTAIAQTTRADKIEGTISLLNGVVIPIADSDLKNGTLTFDNQCVNGDELEFGAVYSGQIAFTIQSDIDRYKLFNATVNISYFLQLPDGTFERVPLGIFYISEPTRKGADITIKALDGMINFDVDYDGTTVFGTPYEMLVYLCEKAGVPLANTVEEMDAMPNGTETIQLDSTRGCFTLRDCVAEISRFVAGFATIDRTGALRICQFGTIPVQNVNADLRYSTEISDFQSSYMGIVFSQKSEILSSYDPEKNDGLIMECDDLPFLDSMNISETKQRIVDNIRVVLCALNYTPSTVSFTGNPAFDLGDAVSYDVDGETVISILTGISWKYRGAEKLKCVGKNPYLTNQKSREAKQLNQISNEIAADTAAVSSYENLSDLTLKPEYTQIINLNATTTKDTSAVFNATIILTVDTDEEQDVGKTTYELETDADGNISLKPVVTTETITAPVDQTITFKYQLNGSDNTQHLPIQTISTGQYIVTLAYPLMDLAANTVNNFRVYALISGGKVTIKALQIKAMINGLGLTNAGGVWDGNISVEETFNIVKLGGNMTVLPFTEQFFHSEQIPAPMAVTETVPVVYLGKNMRIDGFTDNIQFSEIIDREVISEQKISLYDFDKTHVEVVDGAFKWRTVYIYTSTEQTIDDGQMCAVNVDMRTITTESVVIE